MLFSTLLPPQPSNYPECDANYSSETDQSGRTHQVHQGYRNFERLYKVYKGPLEIPYERFAVSPVLYEYPDSPYKVVITESNTYDYPALYMESNGYNSMRGKWANYPKETIRLRSFQSLTTVFQSFDCYQREYIRKD